MVASHVYLISHYAVIAKPWEQLFSALVDWQFYGQVRETKNEGEKGD